MNPLSILRQFVKGLISETEPNQIAAGIAFGFLLGMIPKANLAAQIIILLLMVLKINLPMALLTLILTGFLNPLIDKITDPLGYYLLTSPSLYPLWIKLYNMPIMPWTDFNNTTLLGGLIAGAILFAPVYILGKKFGIAYNKNFKEKIVNSKIAKTFKQSWLLEWYFREGV